MPPGILQYAEIQFHGESGVTQTCVEAVVRLVHFGAEIQKAALLSSGNSHCFLLTVNGNERIAIKSGFSSGYLGEGPKGLATALQILHRHGAEIEEYLVTEDIIRAIDKSALLVHQLRELDGLSPCRPSRWFDYIYSIEGDRAIAPSQRGLNENFPLTLPYALLDPRLMDLALAFRSNPDAALVSAYRRLEDMVRQKSGLETESSSRLFAKAFQGDAPILAWSELDPAEQRARASLFDAVYRAYRNRRAHREPDSDVKAAIREFLLLNELFILEGQSTKQ